MVNARDASALQELVSVLGDRSAFATGDVTDPAACVALATETRRIWGGIDILVCNVGSGASVTPGHETRAEWDRMFAINLASCTNMIDATRLALIERRGAIVCISSICGLQTIPGAPLAYSAAKAALNSYVRGLAQPLGASGVRINAIAPGNILFKGSVWERKLAQNAAAVQSMLDHDVALRRFGEPAEIADFVAFLVSRRAGFATGGIFVVDGGQIAR